MKNTDEVAVFWDYENCPAPTNASGYVIVNNIRSIAQNFGSVKSLKAYLEVTEQVPASRTVALRSELQSSGVSLTDCPHNGRKDVADKMILVDMLAHAIDHPAPSTIVLISGDRDFAYALSILRLRRYRIVLVTLSNAHPSLTAHASLCFDWLSDVLEPVDLTRPHQPISPRREKLSSLVHEKTSSESKAHTASGSSFQESYDNKWPSSAFMTFLQNETRRMGNSSTVPKHDDRHGLLPPDLEQPKRQPAASTVASGILRDGPESFARVINSPIALSCPTYPNGGKDTPLTMPAHGANSSQATVIPNTSAGDAPKLATCGSIAQSRFFAHGTLRGAATLSHLVQDEVASVKEPVSFESAVKVLPADLDVRGSSLSSQQRGAHPFIKAKPQSLSSVDQIEDDGDPDSPPAHSDISPDSPPSNSITWGSLASAPSFMPPPSRSNATVSAAAQGSVKAVNSLQLTSFPAVPEIFKILIRCLKSHKSKGRLRPLRSRVGLEISHSGTTYREAGVLKFSEYVAMAEKAGFIELGGSDGTAWVALKAPWCDS